MLKPIGSKLLVKRERLEAKTGGGLHVPETARRKKGTEGTVVSVGPFVDDIPVGARVFFQRYTGDDLDLDGVPHLMIERADLDAVEV